MGLTLSPKAVHGPRCSVCITLEALSSSDRELVQAWLDDPDVHHTQITRSLRGEGYDVGTTAVGRHRNGECASGRVA